MKVVFLLFPLLLLQVACETRLHSTPHDNYARNLAQEGLSREAALWDDDAKRALHDPVAVALPYFERRFLDHDSNGAVAFAVRLKQDQQLAVNIEASANTRAPVFVDVFKSAANGQPPELVHSMEPVRQQLQLQAPTEGKYLLRIHPSLHSTGLIDVAITSPAQFGFPVQDATVSAVLSRFGVARDGGRRKHEGIDIFAERGRPVLSASDGMVRRVGDTPLGGKHVWVSFRGYFFYYAHLDTVSVQAGDKLRVGDVLGGVGNTGNARTTKPHLHFGIYKRFGGAIDPFPLVDPSLAKVQPVSARTGIAPQWLRVSAAKLNLRTSPTVVSSVQSQLAQDELVRVEATTGDWVRVTTGTGRMGFVAHRFLRTLEAEPWQAEQGYIAIANATVNAPVLRPLKRGESLATFGTFGPYRKIQLNEGRTAWAVATGHLTLHGGEKPLPSVNRAKSI